MRWRVLCGGARRLSVRSGCDGSAPRFRTFADKLAQYKDRAKRLLEEFVDRDAYNFLPSAVLALNESKGRYAVVPLRTEGDGNCLPRAVSRCST